MKAIWIDDDQHKRIKVEAVNKDTQINNLINKMIDEYFDKRSEKTASSDVNDGDNLSTRGNE